MPYVLRTLNSERKGYFKKEEIEPAEVTYNCGPYNYAMLAKNSTREVDEYLAGLDDKGYPYFTERHALLLLSEIEGEGKNVDNLDKSINLITFITVKKSFKKNIKSIPIVMETYLEKFKEVKNIFVKVRFFASMGSENLVVYTNGVSPKKLNDILEIIYTAKEHIEDSYSVIAFNKDILPLFDSNLEKRVGLGALNADILLLCSLCQNKRASSKIRDIDKAIEDALGSNGEIYKLFGIFDYKIRFFKTTEDIFGTIQSFMVAMQKQKMANSHTKRIP